MGSAGRRRAPASLVEFFAVLDAVELSEEAPYFDDVVGVQSPGEHCGENEFAVRRIDTLVTE